MKSHGTKNRLLLFIKDRRKKNIFKMLKETMHLWISKKEIPFYYFKYLYRKEVVNYNDYISTKEARRIQFNDKYHKEEHIDIISNKLIFSMLFKKNNLPVPKLLSYNLGTNFYDNGKTVKIHSRQDLVEYFTKILETSGDQSIFVKPFSLYGGTGCFKLKKVSLVSDVENCYEFVINNSCVHEEVIVQHPEINKIHANCLNTIRFESFIDKNEDIHILSAFMRFGVGDSYVDNSSSGGYYIGVNLEDGTLKKVGHQFMEYGGDAYTKHPDNGYVLEGFKIPHFNDACNLIIKAVQFIPDRYTGWDIAISDKGPVMIEANERASIFGADISYGGYMKHLLYKDIIAETKHTKLKKYKGL